MPSRPTVTLVLCALAFLPSVPGPAEQSGDEETRRKFLKAREETVHPTDPKAKPARGNQPKPKPKPKPHPSSQKTPQKAQPVSKPAPSQIAPVPVAPVSAVPSKEKEKAVEQPASKVISSREDAPVLVEKSGYDAKTGYQPPSFFGWFTRWKYLSKSVRDEIDRAPVQKARWRYIVVHNSGTRQGNAKAFDFYHTRVRKMSNGLAYHFVIGNGTSSGDGQIEVGNRWRRQINGGHVHSDYLNNIALGICLVGDFNQERPTAKQLESLDELIRYLRQRTGKIDGKWSIVKAHKEINPPRWPTDCPGGEFPYSWLHGRFD